MSIQEMLGCKGLSPVVLSKQGCYAAMLVLQRPPVDLGWVGCEHHLCVLRARMNSLSRSAVPCRSRVICQASAQLSHAQG